MVTWKFSHSCLIVHEVVQTDRACRLAEMYLSESLSRSSSVAGSFFFGFDRLLRFRLTVIVDI